MSDSSVILNAQRMYFIVKKDQIWKSLSPETFVSSAEINDDDTYIPADPEALSIRRLIQEWTEGTSEEHHKNCDMCLHEKHALLKSAN